MFHYAQEFFEGLKAYKQDGGSVVMFRPQANAARFNSGARRMAMPELPEEAFVQALELLVDPGPRVDPDGEGKSLYLRPFMIATQRGLGVNHPSSEYLLCVIASPAASYFGAGKTVRVWLSEDYTRAAPGGTGAVKCGGNYAAAFLAQQQAVDNGLRPGRLAGRGRAPVGRGDGRHEPVLRVRVGLVRPDRDARRSPGPCCQGSPATRC